MKGEITIRAERLGKQYAIGHAVEHESTLRDAILRGVTGFGRSLSAMTRGRAIIRGDVTEEFWALRDISFEVRRAEVLGVIGSNGAGKSTLLKILSRITEPTEGRVTINGRVSSLLEVGTGFHPELSGRENIFLNGAILGMTRAEIRAKFDEIVDFAGVERFLDTPVKRYSSGMYVRLAFAVAAHLEPEILIVDEVLAVGDVKFQKKCLGKMQDVAGDGRSVLFVSHNMGAVRTMCDRVITLKEGRLELDTDVESGISAYLSTAYGDLDAEGIWRWQGNELPGGDDIRVLEVKIEGRNGTTSVIRPDESFVVTITYDQLRTLSGLRFVLRLLTTNGEIAFGTTDERNRLQEQSPAGKYSTSCVIPEGLLNRTDYIVRINAGIAGRGHLLPPTEIGMISVEGPGNDGSTRNESSWSGVVCPKIDWTVSAIKTVD